MRHYAFLVVFLLALISITGGCSGGGSVMPPTRGDSASGMLGVITDEPGAGTVGTHPWDDYQGVDINGQPLYKEGEVLVVLNDGVDPEALYPMAKVLGLSLRKEIKLMWATVYKLNIDSGESVESMVEKLKTHPEVRYAEPNYIHYPCAAPYYPNDPLFEFDGDADDDPWTYKYDQWGPNVIGASLCWPTSKGSPDAVIAVLDTGYRHTHEDLANQIWINEDEIPGNGLDDDDNGYIDDWRGWDFSGDDGDPMDTHGHGTGCSGVVVAEQDNDVGCTGVAPGVKVMPLRTQLASDEIMEGAQYAYDNGATALSMSFHTYAESEISHNTYIAIWDEGNGTLPVAAAGNDNTLTPSYPNAWPEVVRVGGTCSYFKYSGVRREAMRITPDQYGWGSSYGETLEIMAPGYLYISTHYGGDDQYYDGVNRGTFGGTSCACPCAAGCFGLLKSAFPEMTALDLRERMRDTCDDLYDPGHDIQSGWGRVNIWRAIYGSEPNEDIYDENGHVPVTCDGTWQYDSIFDISTSADYDFEDIFSLEADATGVFEIEMDVITTGENLDVELFLTHDLSGPPVGVSEGPNDYLKPGETISLSVIEGQKLYLRVYSPEPYNCSNLRVRSHVEPQEWWVEWESLAPIFVLDGTEFLPLLKLEIHTNLLVTLDSIKAYIAGDIPLGLVNHFSLYEDSDDSGTFNAGDIAVGSAVPSDVGVNQIIFGNLIAAATYYQPLRYFIVADVGPNELGYNVEIGAGLRTYKDIEIWQDVPLTNDPFPILSDLTVVGKDYEPPVWDSTVGVQLVVPKYKSVILYWNNATDILNEPTNYNVYWDDEYPPEISTGCMIEHISYSWGGEDYNHKGTVPDLENGKTYYFCVRAIDGLDNEDDNEIWLDGTPDAIADPTAPEVIGKLDLAGDSWEVWVHDKIAYVATGNSGIAIVDCNIPEELVLIDTYPVTGCYGIQYHEGQDYVYASTSAGLIIVDPHAAGGPELVGEYPMSTTSDVFVDGMTCYIGSWSGTLYVLDVTDPTDPQHLGDVALGYNQTIYGLSAQDGYAYCCTSSTGLRIIDATNPIDPDVVKTLTLNKYTYENTIHGDYLLVTGWWSHRLFVIDISDPPNAWKAGTFNFSGGYGAGVAVRDDQYVYFGRFPNAVWTVDWSVFDDMQQVGSCSTQGPDGLYFDGDFLYAAENADGLKVIL